MVVFYWIPNSFITAIRSKSVKTGDTFALAGKRNEQMMLEVKIIHQKFIRLIHKCDLEIEVTNRSEYTIEFRPATYGRFEKIPLEPGKSIVYKNKGIFTLHIYDPKTNCVHILYHFGKLRAEGMHVYAVKESAP